MVAWLSGSAAEHWRLKPEVSWIRLLETEGLFTFAPHKHLKSFIFSMRQELWPLYHVGAWIFQLTTFSWRKACLDAIQNCPQCKTHFGEYQYAVVFLTSLWAMPGRKFEFHTCIPYLVHSHWPHRVKEGLLNRAVQNSSQELVVFYHPANKTRSKTHWKCIVQYLYTWSDHCLYYCYLA